MVREHRECSAKANKSRETSDAKTRGTPRKQNPGKSAARPRQLSADCHGRPPFPNPKPNKAKQVCMRAGQFRPPPKAGPPRPSLPRSKIGRGHRSGTSVVPHALTVVVVGHAHENRAQVVAQGGKRWLAHQKRRYHESEQPEAEVVCFQLGEVAGPHSGRPQLVARGDRPVGGRYSHGRAPSRAQTCLLASVYSLT